MAHEPTDAARHWLQVKKVYRRGVVHGVWRVTRTTFAVVAEIGSLGFSAGSPAPPELGPAVLEIRARHGGGRVVWEHRYGTSRSADDARHRIDRRLATTPVGSFCADSGIDEAAVRAPS